MDIKSTPRCGNLHLESLYREKLSSKNLSKSSDISVKSIPSTSVIEKQIPDNPYVSSITGKYVFDLSKIKNFSVYFWKSTDNLALNPAIADYSNFFGALPLDWPTNYKSQTVDALDQYTSFLNTTSSVTTSYTNSDIVCVLLDVESFLGACLGPEFIYKDPQFVDNKVVFFLSNLYTTDDNILQGGQQYLTLMHEFGHGFGFGHPHDNGFGSPIMPGIGNIRCIDFEYCTGDSFDYPAIAGNINNTVFNTVMSFNDAQFFLPEFRDFDTNKTGYPQTLMPLDASGLRWMYNLNFAGNRYVQKYGVTEINPELDEQKSQMIVGNNQNITFGKNCKDVNFYFSNNYLRFNNLEPVRYQYNRIIEKPYTFYPQDLCSSVSVLNFKNTKSSNIFIEKDALKTDLTINLFDANILNIYVLDLKTNYVITGNVYKNKKTCKSFKIINNLCSQINVFFSK